jgi:hypothetical protein
MPIRRRRMFMSNIGGGRQSFWAMVARRMLRLVSIRSMVTRHASPFRDRNYLAEFRICSRPVQLSPRETNGAPHATFSRRMQFSM